METFWQRHGRAGSRGGPRPQVPAPTQPQREQRPPCLLLPRTSKLPAVPQRAELCLVSHFWGDPSLARRCELNRILPGHLGLFHALQPGAAKMRKEESAAGAGVKVERPRFIPVPPVVPTQEGPVGGNDIPGQGAQVSGGGGRWEVSHFNTASSLPHLNHKNQRGA